MDCFHGNADSILCIWPSVLTFPFPASILNITFVIVWFLWWGHHSPQCLPSLRPHLPCFCPLNHSLVLLQQVLSFHSLHFYPGWFCKLAFLKFQSNYITYKGKLLTCMPCLFSELWTICPHTPVPLISDRNAGPSSTAWIPVSELAPVMQEN